MRVKPRGNTGFRHERRLGQPAAGRVGRDGPFRRDVE